MIGLGGASWPLIGPAARLNARTIVYGAGSDRLNTARPPPANKDKLEDNLPDARMIVLQRFVVV